MKHNLVTAATTLFLTFGAQHMTHAAETFSIADRKIEIDDLGQVVIRDSTDKLQAELNLAFFIPTWWIRSNKNAKDVNFERSPDANQVVVQGSLPMRQPDDEPGKFRQQFKWDHEKLIIESELELPAEIELMPKTRPFMQLSVPIEKLADKRFRMGQRTVDLPADNVHGWGRTLEVEAVDIALEISEDAILSSWGDPSKATYGSFRMNFTETADGDIAKQRHFCRMVVRFKKINLKQEVTRDLWGEKGGNYRRLLTTPTEAPLDTSVPLKWLAEGENLLKTTEPVAQARKLAGQSYARVENWLDLRSRVYDLYDQSRHLEFFNSVHPLADSIAPDYSAAYELLNAGELEQLSEKLPLWEAKLEEWRKKAQERYGADFLPASIANPYSWIKEYSTLGFRKHPEGVLSLEPSPMNVSWFDRLSVRWISQGEKTQLEASGESYTDVVWQDPSSVKTERSWVTTEWLHGDARFTASVLSPLLDMDGTDTVTVSGLDKAYRLSYVKGDALLRHVNLKREKSITFDKEPCARNWMLLQGEGFTFAVILGAFPTEISFNNGTLKISLSSKSFVSLVRLSPLIQNLEQYREAEFWGRVALAMPVQAVETISGAEVTWRYIHRERQDEWGTEPLMIAPVPPLAINGNLQIDGIRTTRYHTKYGLYTWLPGNEVKLTLPADFLQFPVLRGVNVAGVAKEAELEEFTAAGADWVRLFIQAHWDDPEDAYAAVESRLAICQKLGLKVLIDPHDFQYRTTWADGMPTDPADEERFLVMWDRLSQIGSRYPDVVAGYDLYNEMHIKPGSFSLWAELVDRTAGVIRANDQATPLYVTGTDMANTSGFFDVRPVSDDNVVYSFHFYTPHSFSHQMIQTRGQAGSAYLFYPGWITPMDWSAGTHFGAGGLGWYDRWNLGAGMLPIFEFQSLYNLPVHCGEFGVIGYSTPQAPASGRLWTRDTVDWLERYRMGWHIWNMGFGLRHPGVKEDIYNRWQEEQQQ
jgi:endoglucanase